MILRLLNQQPYQLANAISEQGWALRSFPFFSVRCVGFFSVLGVFGDLRDPKGRSVLFRSFLRNGKERKECSVFLQGTEKNAGNAPFFCKEQKGMFRSFFCIYIEIYIDIYGCI